MLSSVHLHTESGGELSDPATDSAEPDYTEPFSAETIARQRQMRERRFADRCARRLRYPVNQCKHQCEGMLGNRLGRVAGNIAHGNAPLARSGDIYLVVARREHRYHPQPRCRIHLRRSYAGAVAQNYLRVAHALDKLLLRSRRVHTHIKAPRIKPERIGLYLSIEYRLRVGQHYINHCFLRRPQRCIICAVCVCPSFYHKHAEPAILTKEKISGIIKGKIIFFKATVSERKSL